jgi:hypothetical protein
VLSADSACATESNIATKPGKKRFTTPYTSYSGPMIKASLKHPAVNTKHLSLAACPGALGLLLFRDQDACAATGSQFEVQRVGG